MGRQNAKGRWGSPARHLGKRQGDLHGVQVAEHCAHRVGVAFGASSTTPKASDRAASRDGCAVTG